MCYAGSPVPGGGGGGGAPSPYMNMAPAPKFAPMRSSLGAQQRREYGIQQRQRWEALGDPSRVEQMRKSGAIYNIPSANQRDLARLAQTEGREFDPRDPYGDVAFSMAKQQSALDKKIADFDARQAQYEAKRAKLGTISSAGVGKGTLSTKQAKVVSSIGSKKATTKGQAATGLKTTYGTTPYGSSGTTGLNVAT